MTATAEIDAPTIIRQRLGDQFWRLNNLYYIQDERGKRVKFRLNWAQIALLREMHYRNVILKARQLGFTTAIDIFLLDTAVFNSNIEVGIIAHTREDAEEIFRRKIKYPYDNLPDWLKKRRPLEKDTGSHIIFDNASSIRVGTSMRSGTLTHLHVSEMGKIAKKYPEKAKEIVTGAFEAVHPGQFIFVESTAEGREGAFYDIATQAEKLSLSGRPLTELDFRFHFFPWWRHPSRVLDPTNIVIEPYLIDYFTTLEVKHGIKLSLPQKAWYCKKIESLGAEIKREHPSTPEEAFEASVEGAYYAEQFREIYKSGRITTVPFQKGCLVDTIWDIGYGDSTAIWFVQDFGSIVHVIDYYEHSGEGLPHYAQVLRDRQEKLGYMYRRPIGPHDLDAHDYGTGETRLAMAERLGLVFDIAPNIGVADGIESVRNTLGICVFDAARCARGIDALEHYRKEWDAKLGRYKDSPLHDWASHGSDAFRYFSVYRGARRNQVVLGTTSQRRQTPKTYCYN